MCVSPLLMSEMAELLVPCRRCWQCTEIRVSDWVGRCIAESRTAKETYAVTLTYGKDSHYQLLGEVNEHAETLFYKDIQDYLKRVRKALGGGVRYLVAGEYGKTKGRAHWHLVLFMSQKIPQEFGVTLLSRFEHTVWPHGWSWWDAGDVRSFRYVCKYLLKDKASGEAAERAFGLSTRPPLGYEYFRNLAAWHVNAGLSPQELSYGFPEARAKSGRSLEFWLQGSSRYYYLRNFCELWVSAHGKRNWPWSQIMDEFEDEHIVRERHRLGLAEFGELEVRARHRMGVAEKHGNFTGLQVRNRDTRWLTEIGSVESNVQALRLGPRYGKAGRRLE